MPEGHVIHRLARRLDADFAGRDLAVSSPQGRFAADAAALDGHRIVAAEAVGKHLFIVFDDAVGPRHIVYIHLGLIGSLRFEPAVDIVGEIRLRLVAGDMAAHLRGPQFCRRIDAAEYHAIRARTGEDPLRDDAHPAALWPRIQRTSRTVAALLMDQKLFAGVGNIYRAEVLFRQGLSPFLAGRDLSRAQFDALWADLVFLMHVGVERGRIDTVRDAHLPHVMGREPRQDDHGGEVYVYRRAGQSCYVCGATVKTQVLQGRNLFWCPGCQA
ncbi:Fpg/Nei family DNA glycosylase [Corynebacterium uterequi]|uniref:DNA-(apurinic or apyrimidinic site) lyase n=1 Tax=Corynebacterium uterequi TaxID=1072256 RepID=A0A0G3HHB0_9CORY|nr:DNA-formamidopyrimidine glycosylase family protein [Corynebacterium uterequi]AKK12140.1 formamidopyrimidine-DNA glycosylase [Corynebacterium uterequi]